MARCSGFPSSLREPVPGFKDLNPIKRPGRLVKRAWELREPSQNAGRLSNRPGHALTPGLCGEALGPNVSIVVNPVRTACTESPGRLGSRRMNPAGERPKPVPGSRIGKCTARAGTGVRHPVTDRDQHAAEVPTRISLQGKAFPVGERRTARPGHLHVRANPCGRPARERQEENRRRHPGELMCTLPQLACMIRQGRARHQRAEDTAGRGPDNSWLRRPVSEFRPVGPFQQGCQGRATIDAATRQPSHGRSGFLRNAPGISSPACRFPSDGFDLVQRPAHATSSG